MRQRIIKSEKANRYTTINIKATVISFLFVSILYGIKTKKITSHNFMLSHKFIIQIFCAAIPIYLMFIISYIIECNVVKKTRKIMFLLTNIFVNTLLNHFLVLRIKSFILRAWCMVFFVKYLLKIVSFHVENNRKKTKVYSPCMSSLGKSEDSVLDKFKTNTKDVKEHKKSKSSIEKSMIGHRNSQHDNESFSTAQDNRETMHKLSLKNFFRYFFLPTLVYKHRYNLKYRFNAFEIVKTVIKMYFTCFVFLIIKKNVCAPILERLIRKNTKMQVLLFIPAFFVSVFISWLLLFYFYFTLFLGLLKSISGFKEHIIYEDWWNSKSIGEFWRKWNIPFYIWVKKYIYVTLRERQVDKYICQLIVFLFSALLHEYAVGVACKKFTGTMFFGMLGQVPLDFICRLIRRHRRNYGNMFFWISFCCIGQPLIVYFYYRDCMISNNK